MQRSNHLISLADWMGPVVALDRLSFTFVVRLASMLILILPQLLTTSHASRRNLLMRHGPPLYPSARMRRHPLPFIPIVENRTRWRRLVVLTSRILVMEEWAVHLDRRNGVHGLLIVKHVSTRSIQQYCDNIQNRPSSQYSAKKRKIKHVHS